MRVKEIAEIVGEKYGYSKRDIYRLASSKPPRLILDFVLFQFPIKGCSVYAEYSSRFGLIPARALDDAEDILSFQIFEGVRVGRRCCERHRVGTGGLRLKR